MEAPVIMMDEEDDEDDEEEDIEEEDLDIAEEIDPDSPPWDMYGDMDVEDQEDTTENTALLRTAAKTEIIVTPISPPRSPPSPSHWLPVRFVVSTLLSLTMALFVICRSSRPSECHLTVERKLGCWHSLHGSSEPTNRQRKKHLLAT
uniref:Uncharacterized protein n=1 Tax=Anopheles atroparvus TaxID=41427 RepID=A0A182JG10_ANOAO